jgi:fructose-1,6-bisphosphatase/inositol monophosphatase family enzyme
MVGASHETSGDDLKGQLDLAEGAARKAGAVLADDSAGHRRILFAPGHDAKIAGDRAAELAILAELRRRSDLDVLSEERGLMRGANPSRSLRWIVDPLDGTVNYSRGIPISCVSIGLWDGDIPVLGCVYDFHRDECFKGVARGPAWLNDEPIRVSETAAERAAILAAGVAPTVAEDPETLRRFSQQYLRYQKVRQLGSAALALAYVACGRVDVYEENGVRLWDAAGGIPIVLGAGGQAEVRPAGGNFAVNVLASNGRIGGAWPKQVR